MLYPVLTTNQKGAIAEAAITCAALRAGVAVYRPVAEGGRADLIFEVGERLLRVQCKSATLEGAVVVIKCYSSRRAPEGFRKRCYTADEVDLIAAYCADLDRCFALPMHGFDGRSHVQLRIEATRNNQQRGVRWAADYELDGLHWVGAGP
jgi:hypothetical protein